jgi:hypothetical protein
MATPIHHHPRLPSETTPVPWATVTAAMARKNGPVRWQWVRPQRAAFAMQATPFQMRAPDQTTVLIGAGRKIATIKSAVGSPHARR